MGKVQCFFGVAALVLVSCLGSDADTQGAAVDVSRYPRIAMMDFTSRDVRYDSMAAAVGLTDLIQALVMPQSESWHWVERQDLPLLEYELDFGGQGIGNRSSPLALALGE